MAGWFPGLHLFFSSETQNSDFIMRVMKNYIYQPLGFPGSADKNPPVQGTRVQSLVWDIPYVEELLNLCTTTTEARMPRARAPKQEKPLQGEARTLQRESSLRSPKPDREKQTDKAVCTWPQKEINKNVLKKAETLKKGRFQCELPGLCCYRKSHILLDILYSKIEKKEVIGTHFLHV